MFTKKRTSNILHWLILFVLVSGMLGVQPARAGTNAMASKADLLNADGALKLDGNPPASFQAGGWEVTPDLSLASVLSPRAMETFAPLATSTPGNWSALGSNLDGTDGAISNTPGFAVEIDVIAVSGTDVYVGGCFQNAGGDPTADYIAKWDTLTASWSGIGNDGTGTPNGALKSCIRALAVDGTNIYVGGFPNAWSNGAADPQAIYAAKWDGTSWSGLGPSLNNQVTSIAISGNHVYVGGYFTDAGSIPEADYVAKWDGTGWSALGNNGWGNGALSGIVETMTILNSDLYVGGYIPEVYNGLDLVPEARFIAKWNGSAWSALGSNGDAPGGPLNNSVHGLASDGTNLYVAGTFTDVNNYGTILTAADYIAKWDGANWSALGDNGDGNGSLNGSAFPIQVWGSDVYVGGAFTDVNNHGTVLTAADYVAKWDGTNWSALGSNGSGNGSLNLYAYTFGLVGNQLFVGGRFTDVNNNGTVLNTADYIAAYEIPIDPNTLTISGNAGISGVKLAYEESGSGTTHFVTSNANGDYSITVSSGWTGTVTPSKAGYIFTPASRDYANLTASQINQDYTAESTDATFSISGNTGTPGVTLSYVDGSLKTIVSDLNGDYAFIVPYNWSGTVTPAKPGYSFDPGKRDYFNVQADQSDQDYMAIPPVTISGNVGVAGAILSYVDSGNKTVTSDGNGDYTITVPYNWSGTVTPAKSGYRFTPEYRNYVNVQTHQSTQGYTATVLLNISGNAGAPQASLYYFDVFERFVVAGNDGGYTIDVPYNWSGVITPSKTGHTFTPSNRVYTQVQENRTGQDYEATLWVTNLLDSGTGSLRQAVLSASPGMRIKFSPSLAGGIILLSSEILIDKNLTIDGAGLNPRITISGGGTTRIFLIGSSKDVILQSLVLKNGHASEPNSGGAIWAYGGAKLTILECEFESNFAESAGGAIYPQTPLNITVMKTRFSGNSAHSGGALSLASSGKAVLENNVFENNVALWGGGAISSHNSPGVALSIKGNLFSNNSAGSWGGAIRIIRFSTLVPILENNTFYANQAGSSGGALHTEQWLYLFNNTFSHNQAPDGGASVRLARHSVLYNNIFANSAGGSECSYTDLSGLLTGNNNIIEDGSVPCADLPGTIIADPMLSSLANNSGFTQTMALLPGSPAIDAGDDANCPATDQRGVTRPQGSGCDIGAYEYVTGSLPPEPTFGDVPVSHPYYNAIEILYANGYTAGCSTLPLNFCPNASMSRAQSAVFMLRGNFGGGYVPVTPSHFFKDNWKNSSWGEGWAESMFLEGLTAGCSASPLRFCPDDILTNVQMAVFGLRLKHGMTYEPPAATGTVFVDLTDVGFWGTGWAEAAYADGLIPACGMSNGKPLFCPNNLVTRGFGASVIVQAKDLTMP